MAVLYIKLFFFIISPSVIIKDYNIVYVFTYYNYKIELYFVQLQNMKAETYNDSN